MSPWQIAQYPIAFCVTMIVICITASFIKILFAKTKEGIDDDDDDDDDPISGEYFIPIDTEDAFKMTEDGEYPKLFIRLKEAIGIIE